MKLAISRVVLATTCGFAVNLMQTTIAFGQNAQDFNPTNVKKSTSMPEVPTAQAPSALESSKSTRFISDGKPFQLTQIGAQIAPPLGWEVMTDMPGLSLVMQEPKKEGQPVDYAKPIFQRNITVAVSHEATPIDEKEAQVLKEKLKNEFSKNTSVKDFQVFDEHKFFNYRGVNDGLVIYASYTMFDIPMTQMHVVVSGTESRFLLTYTDLTSEFDTNKTAFEAAWNAMVSLSVKGPAPQRYEKALRAGAVSCGIAFVLGMMVALRGMRAKRKLEDDSSDDVSHAFSSTTGDTAPLTQSGVWLLDGISLGDGPADDYPMSGAMLTTGTTSY